MMGDSGLKPPEIFVIAGPTASGKTAVGVAVAKRHDGEVVSVDSMQIYRGMNIGTAKPTAEEMGGVVHHMLDVVDPWASFSVAQYVELASSKIDDILSRGKLPILVGGTGLYLDSLLKNRAFAPAPEDKVLRSQLEAEITASERGGEILLQRLRELDLETGGRLFPNDHKRIVRGLEIVLSTGKKQSEFDRESRLLPPRYRGISMGLNFTEREDLRQRMYQRVDLMMEQGLLDEVASFSDLPSDCTAMQAIGYKEMLGYIHGEQSLAEAVELLKIRTRQYGKRQITWFRNKGDLRWYHWEKNPKICEALQFATEYLAEYGVI